jgi:ParB-like chromosome segregation protein Spo0J
LSNIHKSIESFAKPIESLRVDPNNARSHGKESIEGIKVSLMQYGQVFPILVRSAGGNVFTCVAGSGRLTAAKELGWESLACIEWDGTAEQAKAFALVDNRTADLSDWDYGNFGEAIEELLKGDEAETLIALGMDGDLISMALEEDEPEVSKKEEDHPEFKVFKVIIYDPDVANEVMSLIGDTVHKYGDLVEIK